MGRVKIWTLIFQIGTPVLSPFSIAPFTLRITTEAPLSGTLLGIFTHSISFHVAGTLGARVS